MKKQTKQILALLLAICSVVTFMMPTVFATGVTGETEGSAEAAESVVYQFYMPEYKQKKLAEVAAEIKDGYEAGTYNWRYEAAASGYQFRLKDVHEGVTASGGNAFDNDYTESIVYYGGGSQWFAVRIQSPGAGEYALTI